MSEYKIYDSRKGSEHNHEIEIKSGWQTAAKLSVEKMDNHWHIYSLSTKEAHQRNGLAKELVSYVEKEYGPVCIKSENNSFWSKIGYKIGSNGYWTKKDKILRKPLS